MNPLDPTADASRPLGGEMTTSGVATAETTPVPATLRQAVMECLRSNPELASEVGGRISYGFAPSSYSLPYVTFSIASNPHGHTFAGSDGTAVARVQINCWGKSSGDCERASEVIRLRIQGLRGRVGFVDVTGVFLIDQVDLLEPSSPGSKTWIFRVMSDYQINHRVPRPDIRRS